MESLTKENFWNNVMAMYPSDMDRFCKWIDDYKKRVNWEYLFGVDVKYHNLPIAMQVGIFFQFVIEQPGTDSHDTIFGEIHTMGRFATEILQHFKDCDDFTKREQNAN